MTKENENSFKPMSRRRFLYKANAVAAATVGLAKGRSLSGATKSTGAYSPLASHKKLRIGVVGGGFGAAFPWHKHPNCEVTAVAELRDERRRRLEETFQCSNTYAEFHPMLKDSKVDAVAIFTGAPDHVPHCVDVLKSGRHVISAVPAATTLEQCQELADTVKQTGQIYMMAETSCFHAPTMTAREWRKRGKFGRIYYSQADYVHDHGSYLVSGNVARNLQEMFVYKGQRTWRYGYAQGLYLTHASGPVVSVTGEKLTEVTAIGTPVDHPYYKDNQYNNPFLNTTFFFKTSGANSCRINIHWWSAAPGREGADYFGTKMAFFEPWGKLRTSAYITYPHGEPQLYDSDDHSSKLPSTLRGIGGHGGSHPFIAHEFVSACLEERAPAVDVYQALAYTAPGIVGFKSALKDGMRLKVPDFGPIS